MFVCNLALVTRQQIASLLRRIILSSVACLALTYFSTFSQKWQDFLEKNLWKWNVWVDFLCKYVWNRSHFKKHL